MRGVLEKTLTQAFKPTEPQCIHNTVKTYHGMMSGIELNRETYQNDGLPLIGNIIDKKFTFLIIVMKSMETFCALLEEDL